jgi:prolyl-tRNA synthetase
VLGISPWPDFPAARYRDGIAVRVCDIRHINFLDQNGAQQFAWTTSWGVSTRLIGGLLMTHSDDDGFVLPPRIAPAHIAIVPIFRSDDERVRVLEYCHAVAGELRAQQYAGAAVRVIVDERDECGGEKVWRWVRKGVPLRLEIGPRDIEKNAVFVGRRDKGPKEKTTVGRNEFVVTIAATLADIQRTLHARAQAFRAAHTHEIDDRDEFYAFFTAPRFDEGAPAPIHGGFALTHFSGELELEQRIKDELGVTVRCLPLEKGDPGTCPFTGKPSAQRAVWAKAY